MPATATDDPFADLTRVPIPSKLADGPPPDPLTASDILSPTPLIHLRGRIEAEAVLASQSMASRQQIGTLQDGFGFRRARLGAQGTIGSSSQWIAELEFSGGDVRFRDMFIGFTALPVAKVLKVGFFREPFSLEGATSSNYITFLERSPINQLDPARNWGVASSWLPENERMLATLGIFRDGSSDRGISSGNQNNWALTGRLTGLPIYEDEGTFRLMHFGTAISLRKPLNNLVSYEISPQDPLLVVDDSPPSPFLPPINVPSNSQQLYNLQWAMVNGPYSLQAEWSATGIQQIGGGTVFLYGTYIYGSYFLTGEHRGYSRLNGEFDRVRVRRPVLKSPEGGASGIGAIELVARFSYTDFASPNLPPSTSSNGVVTKGGMLYESTYGVNWYLNDFTRIMANYTMAIPVAQGQSILPVHVFGIRTAIHW